MFTVISDKPWLSPLGTAAAYEDIATSMHARGHAFATTINCFEKARELRLSYKMTNDASIVGDVTSGKSVNHEKYQQLLAQLHTETTEHCARESDVPAHRIDVGCMYLLYFLVALCFFCGHRRVPSQWNMRRQQNLRLMIAQSLPVILMGRQWLHLSALFGAALPCRICWN